MTSWIPSPTKSWGSLWWSSLSLFSSSSSPPLPFGVGDDELLGGLKTPMALLCMVSIFFAIQCAPRMGIFQLFVLVVICDLRLTNLSHFLFYSSRKCCRGRCGGGAAANWQQQQQQQLLWRNTPEPKKFPSCITPSPFWIKKTNMWNILQSHYCLSFRLSVCP